MPNVEAEYWKEQNRRSQRIGLFSTIAMGMFAFAGIGLQSYRLEQFKENIKLNTTPVIKNQGSRVVKESVCLDPQIGSASPKIDAGHLPLVKKLE